MRAMRKLGLFVVVVVVAACGGGKDDGNDLSSDADDGPQIIDATVPDAPIDHDASPDAPPDAPPNATLADTGLCLDAGCTQISPDVHEYTPRFPLWTDGATKRRWIYLPPGTQIDTTDMDYWVFPVGTKLWKEFTRDGVRIETRFITKVLADEAAPGAWFYATYQWSLAQDSTMAVTAGVQNANGTAHDIPTRGQCHVCHDALPKSHVLGVGAIALDFGPAASSYSLDSLIAANLLTTVPAGTAGAYRFPLPGTANDVAALGYTHVNCGHCHNPTSVTFGNTQLDLRLRVGALATLEGTPMYSTTVDHAAQINFVENNVSYPTIIVSGAPDNSALIRRMNSTNSSARMPQLGTEDVDPAGQIILRQFIIDRAP